MLVNTPRARKEGGGGGRKREGKKEGNKGAPSYDTSVQGHTKKEGLPAMTKASRKRVKRGKREGKKERGRERERRERKVFPATNNRPGTHQRKRGEILSIPFKKTPESKERKGEGRGRGGELSARQVPMNLKLALTAAVT